ncbi:hypothetical protein F5888DRAFT_796886 [Russula emetica]|nr:hypothetical protein F5888DRAFT_796886 [Russula emetica]
MRSDQAPGLDTRAHSMPVQSVYSSKKLHVRQSTAPPPPYTAPSSPTASEEALFPPHLSSRDPTPPPRLPDDHETSRRLPTPPNPRIAIPIERTTSSPSLPELKLSSLQLSPIQQSSRASSFAPPPITSLSPQSHVNSSSFLPLPPDAPKSRSVFNPLSVLKLSKSSRKATARKAAGKVSEETIVRIAEENAAGQFSRERDENAARYTAAQAEARDRVQSSIHSLLFRGLTSDEERISIFSKCARVCNDCGLDFSAVLQEPLIEGQIPVYWAILNRPVTSPEVDDDALNALIFTLLNASGSLKKTTSDYVRLACMWTSNNALLQHLFWHFPGLSPLSMSDRMLLGPTGGDGVNVEETRDGSGAFVAQVNIRRFRLRMNSSKLIKSEFITFERIWIVKFLVSAESTREGLSENKWLFALELASKSTPAWVDADLLVRGHSHQATTSDSNKPVFSIPIGCVGRALQPGPENMIKVRLDDGPMRLHWINDSLTLLDAEGTLHAELHVRLSQPPVPTLSPDNSDAWSQVPATHTAYTSKSSSERARSPTRRSRTVEVPDKPVRTSLRKGGR